MSHERFTPLDNAKAQFSKALKDWKTYQSLTPDSSEWSKYDPKLFNNIVINDIGIAEIISALAATDGIPGDATPLEMLNTSGVFKAETKHGSVPATLFLSDKTSQTMVYADTGKLSFPVLPQGRRNVTAVSCVWDAMQGYASELRQRTSESRRGLFIEPSEKYDDRQQAILDILKLMWESRDPNSTDEYLHVSAIIDKPYIPISVFTEFFTGNRRKKYDIMKTLFEADIKFQDDKTRNAKIASIEFDDPNETVPILEYMRKIVLEQDEDEFRTKTLKTLENLISQPTLKRVTIGRSNDEDDVIYVDLTPPTEK